MNKEQLINDNIGLVRKVAHGLYINNHIFDFEDLVQIGLLAVFKGLDKFDESRASLSTFITICARNEMIKFLKKQFRLKSYPSSETEYTEQEYFSDIDVTEFMDGSSLDNLVAKLKMQGLSMREISERTGCSMNIVKNSVSKIKKQIRKCLDDE